MKKTFFIVFIMLLIFPILVSAETWDTLYKDYKTFFDSEFECTYENVNNNTALGYLHQITFKGDSSGLKIKFRTSENEDYDATETDFVDAFKKLSYQNTKNSYMVNQIVNLNSLFSYREFMDSIKSLNTCTSSVYLSGTWSDSEYFLSVSTNSTDDVYFKLKKSDVKKPNNETTEKYDENCILSQSYSCSKKMQANYEADKNQFIQISTNNYNSKLGYCMVIFSDSDLSDISHVCTNEIKKLEIAYQGNIFIIKEEQMQMFFVDDKNFGKFNDGYFTWEIDTGLSDNRTKYWYLVYSDYQSSQTIDPPQLHVPQLKPVDNCQSLFGDPTVKDPATPAYYMSVAFSVMRYAAIILLLVLTTMDFVSAVASQDNDILKKTVNKTMKRAMLCVIIFFLPTLINFVLQIIHTSQIRDCIDFNV